MRRSLVRSGIVCGVLAAIIASAPAASAASVSISDSYSRKVKGAWGSAPGAGPWQMTLTSGAYPALSVNNSEAIADAPGNDSKSVHLVGPSSSANVTVASTFTVNYQPTTGRTNHWQLVARHTDIRTYYLFKLVPNGSEPATLEIQRARAGVFTALAVMPAVFSSSTNTAYRIVARVTTTGVGTTLSMRAFRVSAGDPGGWPLSFVDPGAEQLTTGRAGVRLSFYAGPARMTVDDVSIRFD